MPKKKISNLQFIATLIALRSRIVDMGTPFASICSNLTQKDLLEHLQTWRGRSHTRKRDYDGKMVRNYWGNTYFAYDPFGGGRYRQVLWDAPKRFKRVNPRYRLLPRGEKYVIKDAKSVQDLMANYEHNSE